MSPTSSFQATTPAATILLTGAGGELGRGVAQALLLAGYRVIAVDRDAKALAETAEALGSPRDLVIQAGSFATEADAETLVRSLRSRSARVNAVVVVPVKCGGSARLLEKPAAFLRDQLEHDVVTHFITTKALLPLLAADRPNALYLVIGGPAAEVNWAGYAHLTIAGVAQRALTLALAEEAKDLAVRVHHLQLGTPVRTASNAHCSCADWVSVEQLGREVVRIVQQPNQASLVTRVGGYAPGARTGTE